VSVGSRLAGALLALCTVLCFEAEVSAADQYPERPIRVIVPTPPGGGTDILARLTAQVAEQSLKTRIVIENKPGAGGSIGTGLVTRSRPDGYTLGFIFNGALTTLPITMSDVPYGQDSYVPIIVIGYSFYAMCVAPGFPADSGPGFLEELKRHPGKYTYGTDGVGNTMQLAAERIFQHFGIKQVAVPFGGAAETAQYFLSRQIDIYGGAILQILPHVERGAAKCLLLTSGANSPLVPQASGLDAVGARGLDTGLWWGLIGPKGLSQEIVDRLYRTYLEAARSPPVRAALERLGATLVTYDPQQMRELISREYGALHQVAERVGLAVR
jgi:tripartite-type tricarboxylate transporter receptor subunit TctC